MKTIHFRPAFVLLASVALLAAIAAEPPPPDTFEKMEDNIDFDASRYIKGTHTIDQLRDELYDMVVETCDGRQTKSEALGINEIAVMRTCNYV